MLEKSKVKVGLVFYCTCLFVKNIVCLNKSMVILHGKMGQRRVRNLITLNKVRPRVRRNKTNTDGQNIFKTNKT
jgi:hypothetical protein